MGVINDVERRFRTRRYGRKAGGRVGKAEGAPPSRAHGAGGLQSADRFSCTGHTGQPRRPGLAELQKQGLGLCQRRTGADVCGP
jgi:hypothetical protein